MVAIGLDQLADAFNRIALGGDRVVTHRKPRRRGVLPAPRFDVGAIEALNRSRDLGTNLSKIHELLFRELNVAKQRIAEHLVEFGEKSVLVGRKILQIDVVGLRHAEQDLRGDRPLVLLDKINVAWGDIELLGHLRLRKTDLTANAPKARADEELCSAFLALSI